MDAWRNVYDDRLYGLMEWIEMFTLDGELLHLGVDRRNRWMDDE